MASVVASGDSPGAQTYASDEGGGSDQLRRDRAPRYGAPRAPGSNSASGNRPSINARRVDLPAESVEPRAAVRTSRRGRSRGAAMIVQHRSTSTPSSATRPRSPARTPRSRRAGRRWSPRSTEPASDRARRRHGPMRRAAEPGGMADGEAFHIHSSPSDLSSRELRRLDDVEHAIEAGEVRPSGSRRHRPGRAVRPARGCA